MRQKLRVSIFSTRYGHYSISKAIEEILQKDDRYEVFYNHLDLTKNIDRAYDMFYRMFPSLFKIPFKVSEKESISKLISTLWDNEYKKKIQSILNKEKPDIVINNHAVFNQTLDRLAETNKFLYINVVPDPRSFHRLALSYKGYNFTFDEKARETAIDFGVSPDRVLISGWFVRSNFYSSYNSSLLKNKLGIKEGIFTVLIIGGSAGTYGILKTLPSLINQKRDMNVIVICGQSKTLFRTAKILSRYISNKKTRFIILKFASNVDEYIKAADVVIGKAGPNLLFETVAVKKPFIAISHIHGQEDGNIEIINEYKLGFSAEKQLESLKKIKEVINNPGKLKKLSSGVFKLAKYNTKAGIKLKQFIAKKSSS